MDLFDRRVGRRRLAALLMMTPVVVATACGGASSSGGERTYTMQGQVLSVAVERKETVVRHEAIAGFMEAMTMPYVVRDVKDIEGLKPGDLITSTLIIERGGGAYLKDVTKVGDAPLERPAGGTGSFLREGDAAPDATFVDQDGKTRAFSSFRGQTIVVTFIYTKCPLPAFCPRMDRNFAAVQTRLATNDALKAVHLVTVSFDPVTDTPDVLKRHAGTVRADPARWTFLTGDREAIEPFAARFGVSVMRDATAADITHNLRTAIIDAQGTIVKFYTGNEWTPDELVRDLATVGSTH